MTTFDPGGLTFSPTVVSEYRAASPSTLGSPTPAGPILKGEDGNDYYLSGNSVSFDLVSAATGLVVASKTQTQVEVDADAAGITPPPSDVGGSGGSFGVVVIPETAYLIAIHGDSGGVSTSKRIVYYKVNNVGALVVVGGYAGRTGGLSVQFSPPRAAAASFVAAGFVTQQETAGSNNTISFKYPLGIAYYGEGRSTLFVVPSINFILANTPVTENLASHWFIRELPLSAAGFGANVFNVNALSVLGRGFFLPTAAGAQFCQMFYRADLEEHAAGTASPSNTYLSTYASTYVTGLISSVGVSLAGDLSVFGWTAALGSVDVDKHVDFINPNTTAAFPFDDDELNYDGTPGIATENYCCQPSIFPSSATDPDEPWLLFFPRIFRKAGDRDKMGLRVFSYDRNTGLATELDFARGQVWTLGVDVASDTFETVGQAAVQWDRSTGDLTILARSTSTGFASYIVLEFGTFVPVPAGGGAGGDSTGTPEDFRLRAWGFLLDGHSFYVLRVGRGPTWVYDTRTGQWAQWKTGAYDIWDASNGGNWEGRAVAGAYADPYVYEIDPAATLDNIGVVDGDIPISRKVTGLVSLRGKQAASCDALFVTTSVGYPVDANAVIQLRYSDDYGQTFSAARTVPLGASSGEYTKEIAFRSLGTMRAPGRVFEITDVGGVIRISSADAIINGAF